MLTMSQYMKVCLLVGYFFFAVSSSWAGDQERNVVGLKVSTTGAVASVYTASGQGMFGEQTAYYVDRGGETLGPFENVQYLTFSPASDEVAFWGQLNKQWYVYFGKNRIGPVVGHLWEDLRYSKDGQLAFKVNSGRSGFIFVGQKRIGPFEAVNDFQFSPNGKTLVYIVVQKDGWFVFDGKTLQGPYEEAHQLTFSSDGKRFAYWAKQNGKWYVQANGQSGGPFEEQGGLAFSPDGEMLSCTAMLDDGWYAFEGTKKSGPYQRADYLRFSPDGKKTAYAYMDAKRNSWFVSSDSKKIGPLPFENIFGLVYLPDATTVAVIGLFRDKSYLYIDKDHSWPLEYNAESFAFSNDGTAMTYESVYDSHWITRLAIGNATYVGSLNGNTKAYVRDGQIVIDR